MQCNSVIDGPCRQSPAGEEPAQDEIYAFDLNPKGTAQYVAGVDVECPDVAAALGDDERACIEASSFLLNPLDHLARQRVVDHHVIDLGAQIEDPRRCRVANATRI